MVYENKDCGSYLCWLTISSRGYHPPSCQCFVTDMVYFIYLELTSNVIIIKTKVLHIQS